METIRGLIVDDDFNEKGQYSGQYIKFVTERLDDEFMKFGWRIEWDTAVEIAAGLHLIRTAPPFDLVVADLIFIRPDRPDLEDQYGLDLISEARRRSPHTFILAISNGREHLPDLLGDASRNGADHVLLRSQFSKFARDHSPAAIAARIRAQLTANGTVFVCDIAADEYDPAVQRLLYDVGRPTLALLYQEILAEAGHATKRMDVDFLTPGASGALVCAVTGHTEGGGRTRHALKLSQVESRLVQEAERCTLASGLLPPRLLVRHLPERPVGPVNGWYALGAPLLEHATTLRTWLGKGPASSAVEDILEVLFAEDLRHTYAETQQAATEPLKWLAFPHYRQCRVLWALSELREVLTRPDGGNLAGGSPKLVTDLTGFVSEARLPGLLPRQLPRKTLTTYSHGDLHGGNILVYEGRRPTPALIDVAQFERTHWAADPANLAVDLLMRCVDAGAESMFFGGLTTWRAVLSRFADGEPPLASAGATAANSAALSALSWLATNLRRICPAVETGDDHADHRWEWHAALATYLLRATYHSDLPPPKRALAFVAAHDQLSAAVRALGV